MNGIDTAILVVVGASCLYGLWRGLVREVMALLTWGAALVLGWVYADQVALRLLSLVENPTVRYVLAFSLIFMVVMVLGTVLGQVLSKLLEFSGLSLAQRVLGGIFGVLRGVVIVAAAIFVTTSFFSETEIWQQSALIPWGQAVIHWGRPWLGI